jgi:hypothetical protein
VIEDQPFWQPLADQGHSSDIFKEFDSLGEGEVRRRLATYGESYSTHAQLWLKLNDELRDKQRRQDRGEDLASQARMAAANERGADAAQKSAAAAERAASAAEASALESRRYRQIAFAALIVSALALLASGYAIFKPRPPLGSNASSAVPSPLATPKPAH